MFQIGLENFFDFNGEEIVWTIYKKQFLQFKESQTEFRIGNATKKKHDELCIKSKDYDNSFNR